MAYQIRQCSRSDCRFRFPAPIDEPKADRCPKCGSPCLIIPIKRDDAGSNPRAAADEGPVVEALLDNIRSSFNVGAMFRTADGAGLAKLHLVGTTPQPDHPGVRKTSLGAEFSVPWDYYRNGVEAAAEIKQKGFQLWALEVGPRSVSLFDALPAPQQQPILLVVGNEVAGVDPDIMELCDQCVWIPMHGFKRSLNVAIAFGVAAYHMRFAHQLARKTSNPIVNARD